jgi:FAD/FMN-containing dehydrogenase
VTVAGGVATVGAGARLGEVDKALQEHDLAIPGGTCPPVGVAGLTLGGGLGILGRKYGVTCDHLVGAEVVLADGRILSCDDHHEDDLFWALCGAGAGNFGVVTTLVFRAVPAPRPPPTSTSPGPTGGPPPSSGPGSGGPRPHPTSWPRA